jgi:hypothetical protein
MVTVVFWRYDRRLHVGLFFDLEDRITVLP